MINIREFTRVFGVFFIIYFVSFFFIYKTGLNPKILQSEDFLSTATLPFSLIKEHNYDLNEYYDILTAYYPNPDDALQTPYYLKEIGSKYYSFFPSFTSLLVIPVYLVPAYMGYDQSIEGIELLSRIGGAFVTALSVAIFWFVIKKQVKGTKKQILLLITYALATNTFSTSAQGLWQHGTSQLFNSLGLLAILYNLFPLAGLSFGLATVARPTNILPLAIFGIYLLILKYKNTKSLKLAAINGFTYGLAAITPIIIQTIIDTKIYGSILNTGYGGLSHWTANIVEGFLGIWISPSKGLLITSPVLLFVFYGVYQSIKKYKSNALNISIIFIVLIHTLVMGKWYNWFGGYSWGTRMASDVLPFIVFLLIPLFNAKIFTKKLIRGIYVLLLTISILYHFAGLIFFDGVWHTIYDGKSRDWLWSIPNSEAVFSIKRGLNKIGLMPNPIPMDMIQPQSNN